MPNQNGIVPSSGAKLPVALGWALFPVTYPLSRIDFTAKMVAGYFTRIGVYSFGEWNRSWLKRTLIEGYKFGFVPGHKGAKFRPERLKKAFSVLIEMGGIRTPLFTRDGNRLDSMLIRHADVKRRVEKAGGHFVDCLPIQELKREEKVIHCKETRWSPTSYVDVILPPSANPGNKWKEFVEETLSKCGLQEIAIHRGGKEVQAFVTKEWHTAWPSRPKEHQCFIRCNSPTESYAMGKGEIFRFALGLRQDMLCFDYPGTWKSEGVPYEGTYYLAGEAAAEKAAYDYGYRWEDIWAIGFCLGGGIATHLKAKYHDKRINLLLKNAFNNMKKTLEMQPFPASKIAPWCRDRLKEPNSIVEQDGFDNVSKLAQAAFRGKKGYGLLINSRPDRVVGKGSYEELRNAAEGAFEVFASTLNEFDNPKINPHRIDPMQNRRIMDLTTTFIDSKDRSWF